MAKYDDVHTSTIAYVGLLSVIVTVAIVLLLQVIFYRTEAQLEQMLNHDAAAAPVAILQAGQTARLHRERPVYLDREKGIVAISIDRAKALVVDQLSAEQEKAAAELEGNRDGP